MPKYIITYDLNKKGADYAETKEKVEERIRSIPTLFPTVPSEVVPTDLPSTWIVKSEGALDINEMHRHVLFGVDGNDELLVGELGEVVIGKWSVLGSEASLREAAEGSR